MEHNTDALETASPENILLNTDKYPVVLWHYISQNNKKVMTFFFYVKETESALPPELGSVWGDEEGFRSHPQRVFL